MFIVDTGTVLSSALKGFFIVDTGTVQCSQGLLYCCIYMFDTGTMLSRASLLLIQVQCSQGLLYCCIYMFDTGTVLSRDSLLLHLFTLLFHTDYSSSIRTKRSTVF